jgi:hypothetical protein
MVYSDNIQTVNDHYMDFFSEQVVGIKIAKI